MGKKTQKEIDDMDKHARYRYKMNQAGFTQKLYWIHQGDVALVKKYIDRKRQAREKAGE